MSKEQELPEQIILKSDTFRIESIYNSYNQYERFANQILNSYKKELESFTYQLRAIDLLEALQGKKKLETESDKEVYNANTLIKWILSQEIKATTNIGKLKFNWENAFRLYEMPPLSPDFTNALTGIYQLQEVNNLDFEVAENKIAIKEGVFKKIQRQYSEVITDPAEILFYVRTEEAIKVVNDLIHDHWADMSLHKDIAYYIEIEQGNLKLQKTALKRIFKQHQEARAWAGLGSTYDPSANTLGSAHKELMFNPHKYPGVNI